MSQRRRDRDRQGARSLHVRGYNVDSVGDRELRGVFEQFGQVVDVYLPRDYFTKDLRGFAYVQFANEADADEARRKLDRNDIFKDGREVHIMWAAGERKSPNDMRRIDVLRDNPHARRARQPHGDWPGPGGGPRGRSRSPRKRPRSPSPRRGGGRERSPYRGRRRRSRSPYRRGRSRSPGPRRDRSPYRRRDRSPRRRTPPGRSPRRGDSRSPHRRGNGGPGGPDSPLRGGGGAAGPGGGRMSPGRRGDSRSPPPRRTSRSPPPKRRAGSRERDRSPPIRRRRSISPEKGPGGWRGRDMGPSGSGNGGAGGGGAAAAAADRERTPPIPRGPREDGNGIGHTEGPGDDNDEANGMDGKQPKLRSAPMSPARNEVAGEAH